MIPRLEKSYEFLSYASTGQLAEPAPQITRGRLEEITRVTWYFRRFVYCMSEACTWLKCDRSPECLRVPKVLEVFVPYPHAILHACGCVSLWCCAYVGIVVKSKIKHNVEAFLVVFHTLSRLDLNRQQGSGRRSLKWL